MTEISPVDRTSSSLWGINVAIGCLLSLAAAILLVSISLGVLMFVGTVRFGAVPAGGMIFVVMTLPGILLGTLLFSLAMILTGIKAQLLMLHRIQKSSEHTRQGVEMLKESMAQWVEIAPDRSAPQASLPITPVPTVAPVQPVAENGNRAGDFEKLLAVMTELRDTLLLSETQRAALVKNRLEQKRRTLIEKLHHHLRHEEWKAAQDVMKEFTELFPDDPHRTDLADEITFARRRKIDRDLVDAQDRIRASAATGRWDTVEPIITHLELQYPDDETVVTYARQIRGEMETWHSEQRQNLIAQLKEASDHRQWRRASLIAQQLLEKYPEDKMVEKLRAELPVLRNNADLQEVKDLEGQFKELLQRRRYEEAFPIAQKVIDEHPQTAAAGEMVKMLPKLQELIKQEKARRKAELGPG
jgi:outer membrane protein assembly factor BamD (BamD/ComL family)